MMKYYFILHNELGFLKERDRLGFCTWTEDTNKAFPFKDLEEVCEICILYKDDVKVVKLEQLQLF